MRHIKLRAVVDVTYRGNGETEKSLGVQLDHAVGFIADRGLFTGETDAEVLSWALNVGTQPKRSAKSAPDPAALIAALREFVQDVEAVGLDYTAEDWPDIAVTYAHAKTALEAYDKKA